MKKRWILLIASTTLILVFFAGGWAGVKYWQSVEDERRLALFLSEAKTHFSLLLDLKNSNQTDAVLLLENKLDTDIYVISLMLDDRPELKGDLTKLLSSIAQYRKSTNYRSSSEKVAFDVNQALERVEQPNLAFKRDALKRAP